MANALGGRGPVIIIVLWVESIIACITCALRVHTRMNISKARFGWDDGLSVASGVVLIGAAATGTWSTLEGYGRATEDVLAIDPRLVPRALLARIISQAFMIVGIATSKASVAAFLLRIVAVQWHKAVLWFTMLSLATLTTIINVLNFLQCTPPRETWERTGDGYCWLDITPPSLTLGIYCTIVDFGLALFPWLVVWNLNMPKKDKINIGSALSLGVLAGIAGAIRTSEIPTLGSRDQLLDTVRFFLYSNSELAITVIAANIAALRPLWKKWLGRRTNVTSSKASAPLGHATIGGTEPSRHRTAGSQGWNELDKFGAGLGNKGRGHNQASAVGPENTSEENILQPKDGIRVKDELDVSVESRYSLESGKR
ncbi:hypothetical protein MBLNU230_g7281t1 [Neophaeotheca triangularis]